MGEDTPAEDEVLGPYGRRSWLSDHPLDEGEDGASPRGSSAPTLPPAPPAPSLPFAPAPAAPASPAPVPTRADSPAPLPPPPPATGSDLPSPPVVPQASDRVGVPWARRPWDPQPVSAEPEDWWSPAAVNPHPPGDAVASRSYRPISAGPIHRTSPWQVVDAGERITVSYRYPARRLIGTVVAVPAALLLLLAGFQPRGVAAAFLVLIGALVAFQRFGQLVGPRTLVTADGQGLHLRMPGRARAEWAVVAWEHAAQFVSMRPMLSGVETWYVERIDGSRVPIASAPSLSGPQAGELRSIIRGVAVFPVRFDRPPIPVDGVAMGGDGRFAHLPPPPIDRSAHGQNENVF